jgi:hypothetical protein
MKDVSQKLEGLDITHSRIHHEFHISAKLYDIEIFGHPTNHRDIEQKLKPVFFTRFCREEYSPEQS